MRVNFCVLNNTPVSMLTQYKTNQIIWAGYFSTLLSEGNQSLEDNRRSYLCFLITVIVKNNSQNLLSADSRPSVSQQLADSRPSVGRQLANSRPTVGQLLADRLPTVNQQLADRQPTVGQQFVICLRPKCWPAVGQQSANSR